MRPFTADGKTLKNTAPLRPRLGTPRLVLPRTVTATRVESV